MVKNMVLGRNCYECERRVERLLALTLVLCTWGVDAYHHDGLKAYGSEYEIGFVYRRVFVVGYCEFIHGYVRSHGIDRILFLSRDGDIPDKRAVEKIQRGIRDFASQVVRFREVTGGKWQISGRYTYGSMQVLMIQKQGSGKKVFCAFHILKEWKIAEGILISGIN